MRISSAVLGLAFIAGFVAPVFAAESPFVGKWTATAAAPTGPASEIVTVTKVADGYSITAKLVAPTPGQPEAGFGSGRQALATRQLSLLLSEKILVAIVTNPHFYVHALVAITV